MATQILQVDTTWSDIVDLDDTIQIAEGVTLTISAGSIVTGGSIEVYGSLVIDGHVDNKVSLTDVDINLGNGDDNNPASIDIHYANVINGSFLNAQSFTTYGSYSLTDSYISGWSGYQHLWYPTANVTIARNIFINTPVFVTATKIDAGGSISFVNNLFYDTSTSNNASPVIENWEAFAGSVAAQDNSFLNADRVALALKENYTSAQIQAQGNWFDSIDVNVISTRVLDANDSSNYASIIDTSGYLSSAATSTPILNSAIVKGSNNTYLHNTTIHYYGDNADTGISTRVNIGDIEIAQSVIFDEVKLSATDVYNFDINISDAIDVLRHIVDLEAFTPGSAGFHAADVDNNGSINISDAIDILRHIVDLEAIDTFDIIDSDGNRVTKLDASSSGDVPTWTIVANGDADLSGGFDATYVTTINKPPILSTPTQESITEDATSNIVTGSLSATDPELDALSYSIVGETAVDNIYTVTGTYGTITLDSTDGSYSYALNNSLSAVQALSATDSVGDDFSVKVSDGANTTAAQTLSFAVTGANDAPNSIALSGSSINENSLGATVGSLSASDPENDNISYSLGVDNDESSFEIVGGSLKLKNTVSANKEVKSSYTVEVTAEDTDAASTTQSFTIAVGDVNESPILSTPTQESITEDATSNIVTGSLSATDPELDALSYSIVGETAVDNIYTVTGTYGTITLDSTDGSYSYALNNSLSAVQALSATDSVGDDFSVKVSDGANTTAAQTLSFAVTGANDAPSINVSNLTNIDENTPQAVAALVSANDTEDGSLSVVLSGSGVDDDKFEIINGDLRIKASADYETQSNYRVQLSVTDTGGTTTLKNIEISVNDLAESITGSVVDGYVAGATIFQDLNNNNILDVQEPYTVTSSTGEFTLTNIVSSSSAPLKIISGFDIGTNKAIVTSLGSLSTSAGQVVVSPLSTIASLTNINDSAVGSATSIDRTATYFDVSSTSQSKIDLLSDDPLDKLRDSDADVVLAAKDVFEANQLVMALTHTAESFGDYLAAVVDAAVQAELSSQGITGYDVFASGSIDDYKKLAADAFMESTSAHIVPAQTLTSDNAFQISSTQVIWNDYDPASQLDIQNRVTLSTTDLAITIDTSEASFNLQNLKNAANETGVFKTPTISVELAKVPTGSGSGTISIDLIDGNDAIFTPGNWPNSGERKVHLDINIDWTADGATAQITLPVQTVLGYYYISSGSRIDFEIDNLDSDTISITKAGLDYPASLDLNFISLIDKFEQVGSISVLQEGSFHLTVSTDLPLADESGNTITSIGSILKITDGSPLSVFVADADAYEGDATPTAVVYLNQSHSEDITITYSLGSNGTDTATAGTDYSVISSNTVTILAGYTSATINLPILEDLSVENNETLTLSIDSVSAGVLSKSTASITIHDSTTTVQSSGELTSLSNDVVDTINSSITSTLEDAYKSAATNADKTWTLNSDVFTNAANDLAPGLKTIMDVFYSIIQSEIDTAADTQDVTAFATALMVANTATKLFDPSTIIGTNINGDGSYLAGQSLTTLTAAIEAEYTTFKTLANDTIGDIFGDDTATNFANATVAMLTDGNDTETLSNASEIIATFDGADVVYGLGGNDKMIGGKGIDTLYGGDGDDHLYGFNGDDVLDGGAGDDKIVGGLGDDTISAGAGDDLVMAQTGDDIINTGAGNDEIYGGLGNDAITVDDTGNKIIDGGAGTDTLTINYSGISSIGGFTISTSGDYTVFTYANDETIQYKNVESLTVGSYDYINTNSDIDGIKNGYWNSTEGILYLFNGGNLSLPSGTHFDQLFGQHQTEITSDFTVLGSELADTLNLNVNRSGDFETISGDYTLAMNAGNDIFNSAKLKNGDSIDMGSGDDSVSLMFTGSSGTPTITNASLAKLDGGAGRDTLKFEESGDSTTALTLSTAGATNFENITGTRGAETITGDGNSNYLAGRNSSYGFGGDATDIIYGLGGDDQLYAAYNTTGGVGGGWENLGTWAAGLNFDGYTALSNISGYYGTQFNDTGAAKLYGGAGDDILFGAAGEDTLDGGTGRDVLVGGSGIDTFIIRVGDGSTTLTNADAIYDFTDGTDVIGMDDGLSFDDLTIVQGTGNYSNHALVSVISTGEYLAVVQSITANNLTAADFVSTSTADQTINGISGNDTLIGGSGGDTFTTGMGSDSIYAHGGNDAITVDDTGNKIIDGGAGTDTLTINYSGISSIGGFTISTSGDYTVFTYANDETIQYKNVESLTVGSYDYINTNSDIDGIKNGYWNSTEGILYLFNGGNLSLPSGTHFDQLFGQHQTEITSDFTVLGSELADTLNLNVNRSGDFETISGDYTLAMNAGNDIFNSAKLKNGDSIDMGSGDDSVSLMFTGSSGTPTITNASLAKLDGGAGRDTLKFEESGDSTTALTLSTAGATNFENITGTRGAETITGDGNSNYLAGRNSSYGFGGDATDIIYGLGGDDQLYAAYNTTGGVGGGWENLGTWAAGLNFDGYTALSNISGYYGTQFNDTGAAKLYGGAGDDILFGAAGEDTLDGGTGRDVLVGGSGIDTFIIRVGDGSTTLTNADAIYDFTDGTDVIGMDDGLSFDDLTIVQGTGNYSNDTLVSITSTGEYLAIVEDMSATALTELDFTPVDIL